MDIVWHESVIAVREQIITHCPCCAPNYDTSVLILQKFACQGVEVDYPGIASLFCPIGYDHVLQNKYQQRILELLCQVGCEHVQASEVEKLSGIVCNVWLGQQVRVVMPRYCILILEVQVCSIYYHPWHRRSIVHLGRDGSALINNRLLTTSFIHAFNNILKQYSINSYNHQSELSTFLSGKIRWKYVV